ncbi:glycerophosphodiester phosphodiesterase [Bacillus shivajii]|uniref:glycerophosphodiester phosphodiesterase n=1 Tax=Bacillus shivajii TaxID=1983719 RepID=UPI001CFB86DD|nr:glycerophosphodiester phosphodiesterase [Bacillus shivajii]UCZ53877.1 glycerophosphodiester phosphodiesterase [Bacillus shivajii]
MNRQTKIFAHRGSSSTHPENTMEAFQAALQYGADGIELDVQLTKDGVPVVIHDEKVDRTTNGNGWVKDLTYNELKQLDAGSWFDPSFSHTKIPRLEDVLNWLVQTPLLLNIELKNGFIRYPEIEKKVLDLVHRYNMQNRVIFSSFNHYSLVDLRKQNRHIEIAILFMEGLYEPWNYAKTVGANALHCYYPVAVPELIAGSSQAGMPVRPFTINDEGLIATFIQRGCNAIMTDFPEKAVHIRKKIQS